MRLFGLTGAAAVSDVASPMHGLIEIIARPWRSLATLIALMLVGAMPVNATLYVALGDIALQVDEDTGAHSTFFNDFSLCLAFDSHGTHYFLDGGAGTPPRQPRILKRSPGGSVSTFTTNLPAESLNDLAVAPDGTVFLLTGDQIVQYEDDGDAVPFVAMGGHGFAFGPGGNLYLAGDRGAAVGKVVQITRAGAVSTYYDGNGEVDDTNFIDLRFDSN